MEYSAPPTRTKPVLRNQPRHTEEIHDIITKKPSWLLRWGITLFFTILLSIVLLSVLIRYPDIVKTQLKINSANSPKPVVTKVSGNLVKILTAENQMVDNNQALAYMESTANHDQVLRLLQELKNLQKQLFKGHLYQLKFINKPHNLELGELQSSYQSFYLSYLTYKSSIADGLYLKKKLILQEDLSIILLQKNQLLSQKALHEKDFDLAKQEYAMHQKLAEEKVEPLMEFRREESKFLAKEFPLRQTESALLANHSSYLAKKKEIMELENQINEEKSKFIQVLNSLISEIEAWKNNYVLSASLSGKVAFAGVVQENQFLNVNQEVFFINPGNVDFFGEMAIPQYNMGKVKEGQEVLVKLKSYPYEEFGMMRGKIESIAEIPYQDSIFISRVVFSKENLSSEKKIRLKNGMYADAEIITEDVSLLGRLSRNIIKVLK